MATAKKISSTLYRTIELERAAIDEAARTVPLSFSSEEPVERWFGNEVLDHGDGSVDLSRLNDGHPLLFNHDPDRHIGVIEEARVINRRGQAVVRFADDEEGEKYFRRVKSGVLRKVSVGYRLMDRDMVEVTGESGSETYRFKRWQPFEISLVTIPADNTVGVLRSEPTADSTDFELPMKRNLLLDPAPVDAGGGAVSDGKAQRERISEIRKLGKQFRGRIESVDDLVDEAIDKDVAVADFQRSLLSKLSTSPIPGASTDINKRDTSVEIVSPGEALIRSAEYKSFISGDRQKFSLELRGTLPQLMTRATLTTSGLTSIQKVPGVVLVEQQPLRVADLFGSGMTTSTTIRFTKEDSFTNAATAVDEEGQKPEATFSLSESDVTIKKIAVVGRVSDEMFADFEYAQSYVNNRLLFMVAALEDNHLLNGTGNTNQIRGILNVSGIQTEAVGGSATALDAVHKAITKIRAVGFYEPDAIVLHPNDWQKVVLSKDANGQYYAGGPITGQYGVGGINRSTLWGLPVVTTTAIAEGTGLVGAFKIGATVFRKGGITIESTNSDASDFQYNRIAIRAEERLALVPYRPTAFCTVTGL
jgi:HK97 family phage major capsid protein/HK97 family phage prohead protease